jgi:glycosyltransferase involved in cell wall biosynthesis
MGRPFFSVIIPTFNRAAFVGKAVESVLSQKFADVEVIVIDDGSTDETADVLQGYGKRILAIHQANAGVATARNSGIERACGEWIAFLDSDDEWLPEYLAWQAGCIGLTKSASISLTNSYQISVDGAKKNTFERDKPKLLRALAGQSVRIIQRPLHFVLKHHLTTLQSTVVKHSALQKAGPFNPNLSIAEDFDLIARVALQGDLVVSTQAFVHICRRAEMTENLTSQLWRKGLHSQEAFGFVLENLKTNRLNWRELQMLNSVLSSNRRFVGNLYLMKGDTQKAKEKYKDAFRIHPSIGSLLRYLISYLPAEIARTSVARRCGKFAP